MASPTPKAKLLLYVASSGSTVSAALVEEWRMEGTLKKVPIYFVSKPLAAQSACIQKWKKWHMQWSWWQESFGTISKVEI
jgi:hypothetical protein